MDLVRATVPAEVLEAYKGSFERGWVGSLAGGGSWNFFDQKPAFKELQSLVYLTDGEHFVEPDSPEAEARLAKVEAGLLEAPPLLPTFLLTAEGVERDRTGEFYPYPLELLAAGRGVKESKPQELIDLQSYFATVARPAGPWREGLSEKAFEECINEGKKLGLSKDFRRAHKLFLSITGSHRVDRFTVVPVLVAALTLFGLITDFDTDSSGGLYDYEAVASYCASGAFAADAEAVAKAATPVVGAIAHGFLYGGVEPSESLRQALAHKRRCELLYP